MVKKVRVTPAKLSHIKAEAVTQMCSVKKMFLVISQNSQESTWARVSFSTKLHAATLLKKRLYHKFFPVSFAKFLRTPLFKKQLRWLLLQKINVLWDSSKKYKTS